MCSAHRFTTLIAAAAAIVVLAALACAPRVHTNPSPQTVGDDDSVERERTRRELERLAREADRDDQDEGDVVRPILPVTVLEPPVADAELGEGLIDRDELQAFIELGPQAILQAIEVDPVFEDDAFRGFRIDWLAASPSGLVDSGLRLGDIVTSVNGVDISQPAGFMRVWESLPEVGHLHVDIVRAGEARTLAWAIE